MMDDNDDRAKRRNACCKLCFFFYWRAMMGGCMFPCFFVKSFTYIRLFMFIALAFMTFL
jgi:hypothetical protein